MSDNRYRLLVTALMVVTILVTILMASTFGRICPKTVSLRKAQSRPVRKINNSLYFTIFSSLTNMFAQARSMRSGAIL